MKSHSVEMLSTQRTILTKTARDEQLEESSLCQYVPLISTRNFAHDAHVVLKIRLRNLKISV